MAVEIITREDLDQFRLLLLKDITEILNSKPDHSKKWLKAKEVRELLKISPCTLQNLRINGSLTFTKIGATLYYDNTDIEKLLNKNKIAALPTLFK
ncbi:helix-turn-helix domain-containing protein [Flavobacterium limnophilum]|uniref:helix-turn-helix domain-containing protein n=1 Tax=Flavobacterium limnophilum TaxID=3003262 RepID=UPI0024822A01|nr:helix-turn-helix domain-containing protein [Flavobacterium limnophilum]